MEQSTEIRWSIDPASAEIFHALPLLGRSKELLGVLFVGSSQRTVVTLERRIRWLALGVVAVGLLFGLDAELVGRRARHAAGAETGRRRAGSGGRELERAGERARDATKWGSWRKHLIR